MSRDMPRSSELDSSCLTEVTRNVEYGRYDEARRFFGQEALYKNESKVVLIKLAQLAEEVAFVSGQTDDFERAYKIYLLATPVRVKTLNSLLTAGMARVATMLLRHGVESVMDQELIPPEKGGLGSGQIETLDTLKDKKKIIAWLRIYQVRVLRS